MSDITPGNMNNNNNREMTK